MPFGERTMSEQRASLVKEIEIGERSLSALCRKYGVSRPTAYKWLSRSHQGESMESRSRAPLNSPNKTSSFLESVILRARERHPCWGGRKLKAYLERQFGARMPCASTINAILHRNGLISRESSLAATPWKRFEMGSPNLLWQTDFKGHFGMEDGIRCHPLTITDDMSRFSLCVSAKDNERLSGVRDSFMLLFRERGLPDSVLCDNGNPWGTSGMSGYTKFEVFLMDYGILPIHGKPLHPQTQGKEERFHRTLKNELLKYVSIRNLSHAQREFDAFRKEYNEERPHCALNYAVPADRYRNSEREMPSKIEEWIYPQGCHVCKTSAQGYALFKGGAFFMSEAFCGQCIALAETQEDGVMDIVYRNFKIATIDLKKRTFVSRKIARLKKNV